MYKWTDEPHSSSSAPPLGAQCHFIPFCHEKTRCDFAVQDFQRVCGESYLMCNNVDQAAVSIVTRNGDYEVESPVVEEELPSDRGRVADCHSISQIRIQLLMSRCFGRVCKNIM